MIIFDPALFSATGYVEDSKDCRNSENNSVIMFNLARAVNISGSISADVDESGITEIYYNDVRKKYLSFGGLMKWYKWFNDYYYLLNHPTCRNHTYSSISEYEKVELNDYITDDFREYTEQYDAMGGEKMYNFIVEKCIPRLEFSGNTKMVDYWGTSYLYYPQCITWYGWFSERHEKYGSFDDISSCTNSIDCCDCKEYFDRGGNDMYEMLKNFIEEIL